MEGAPNHRDEPASNAADVLGGLAGEGSEVEPKPAPPADADTSRPGSAPGSIVGRRYEIVELLGAGRRGTVLLARDRLTDARVAVKRLRTDDDLRESAEIALRAAESQAVMRHPNIARVFDVGEDPSGPYIVSEYIDGPDLARVVTTQGAMEVHRAIQTVGKIGEAVMAAHERGLFHGSLRGSNVLLAPGKELKITDFSIEGIDPSEHPRARRQDVRGLARTLCQLLTGVSRGTINVHELPRPIRPVIRHAMGRSVAARQSTMEHFLRELRATELEIDAGVLSEADAIRRGREAELSGSFAAMREAGEEARQANAESAEAMVLLRRADALEAEKNELVRLVAEREAAFDYAGALDALGRLIRKFPADHHALRLAGQKRQTLAELTRLRGLGEQMVAAGRIADSLGTWQRVLQLRADDPAAQEQVRLGRRARTRRRLIAMSATAGSLAVVAGAAWAVWSFTSVRDIPGLFGNPPASPVVANQDSPPPTAGSSAPATTNPLVRGPIAAGSEEDAALTAADDRVVTTIAGGSADDDGDDGAEAGLTEAEAEALRAAAAAESAATRAARDASSARSHALEAGAAASIETLIA
ncbi:MAG: protein kinase domain-containing protein, partial [Phycisphaerales bacterium]